MVAVALIVALSVRFLEWDDVVGREFLKNVLAGVIGVALGGLAAIALSILLVDRYQRRRRADRWQALGRDVASDVVRTLESWVIWDLSEINLKYRETVRTIITEGQLDDWRELGAETRRKNKAMFAAALDWLADPKQEEIDVESLAMVRIHSNVTPRLSEMQELQGEVAAAGFDDPGLIIQVRRLRQSWEQLRLMLRLWKIDMVMSDKSDPPPDHYQQIVEQAKWPTANLLLIFMVEAQKVRQMLLAKLDEGP